MTFFVDVLCDYYDLPGLSVAEMGFYNHTTSEELEYNVQNHKDGSLDTFMMLCGRSPAAVTMSFYGSTFVFPWKEPAYGFGMSK